MKKLELILSVIGCLLIVGVGGYMCAKVFYYAMLRNERIECEKLVAQAEEYSQVKRDLFYITKIQDEMCKAHGITINAPIK